MKIFKENILKYLPIIIGIVVLFSVADAYAAAEWIEKTAAAILGIDTSDNCVPPQAHSSCLFCPLFKVLYNAGSFVAGKAYAAFSSDLGKLILTFLAVSLAIIIFRNLATMNTADPGTLLNDICRKVFVCIAIFIIITSDYYNLMNITLIPVIQTGLDLANMDGSNLCTSASGIVGFSSSAGATENAGLPKEVGTMIVCAAENIESKINLLFETGRWGVCLGMGPDRLFHILPHPIYLIDSLFLYLGGIFFLVGYPWVLGDAILQLGIAMALLPFAVAGYAFDGTKSYLGKVFGWILHSVFVFIFMAVLIMCILEYIANLLGASTSGVDRKVLFTDPNAGIAFYGPNMLMLIFVLVIGWSYMPSTKDLAKKFAAGSGLSAAGKLGTALAEQMEKQSGKILDKAGEITVDAAKHAVRAGSRQGLMGMTKLFGKDDGSGNKTLSFRGVTFTTMKNADGSSVLKREFTSITGRKHVMLSDKYSTLKQEYDANGNLIKNEVKFKQQFADKYLFNSDGSMNVGAMQALLDSPLAKSNPAYKQAIMEQMAINAIKAKGHKFSVDRYYHSREVVFDPDNPNKILVKQKDYNGNETTFSMNVNMDTGQIAVNASKSEKRLLPGKKNGFTHQYTSIFDNGVAAITTKGRRNPITGEISNEKTSFRYSEAAMVGHASFLADSDKNQIIDSNGNISNRLQGADNPLNLTFGMDEIYGLRQHITQAVNIVIPNSSDPNNPSVTTVAKDSYIGQDFMARQNGTWRTDGGHMLSYLAQTLDINASNAAFMEALAEINEVNDKSRELNRFLSSVTGKSIDDPDFEDAVMITLGENLDYSGILQNIDPRLDNFAPNFMDNIKNISDEKGNFSRILASKMGLDVNSQTIKDLNDNYLYLQSFSSNMNAHGGKFAELAAQKLGLDINNPAVMQFVENYDFSNKNRYGTDETSRFLNILATGHRLRTNALQTNLAQEFIFGTILDEYGSSSPLDDLFGEGNSDISDSSQNASDTEPYQEQSSHDTESNREAQENPRRDSSQPSQEADSSNHDDRAPASASVISDDFWHKLASVENIMSQSDLSTDVLDTQKQVIRELLSNTSDLPDFVRARLNTLLNR